MVAYREIDFHFILFYTYGFLHHNFDHETWNDDLHDMQL